MVTLYPDQLEAVSAIRNAYGAGKRAILFVAPCAFGKTVIFSYIAHGAIKRNKNILILAHRDELIDQISTTLASFDIKHGIMARKTNGQHQQVMVASIQTMARRLEKNPHGYAMIIIDEAHHCTLSNSFGRVIAAFPSAKLLGVTATPCRLSGEGLGDIFDHMIVGPSASELISAGRLSPFKLFAPPSVDVSGLRKRGGDYQQEQVSALMDKPKITGDAIMHYKKYAIGKPFVAFCASIKHAMSVADGFQVHGINAVCIHGKMDDILRRSIVNDFRRGQVTGLVSVDLISEGFDVPGIICGLFLRPTASRGLHIQQFGRCLRLAPEKAHAVILDHVGNSQRHGIPTDPQQWSLAPSIVKSRNVKQEVSIRICPTCYAANAAGSLLCKECGYIWPIEARIVEQTEGELVEWAGPKAVPSSRLEEWRAKSLEDLQELGRQRGYAPGWAWVRYRARQRKVGAE